MSIELVLAISLTIGVSAMCSTLEAMILSVTTAEIESLKLSSPRKGAMLSKFRHELEETSSAIRLKHNCQYPWSNSRGRNCRKVTWRRRE